MRNAPKCPNCVRRHTYEQDDEITGCVLQALLASRIEAEVLSPRAARALGAGINPDRLWDSLYVTLDAMLQGELSHADR